jgi:hypothetical protein
MAEAVSWRRTMTGLGLLAVSDAAYATAVLLSPMWLVSLTSPAAGYGSALALGPAVLVLALALCARPARAVFMLVGLVAGLAICAVWWSALPPWSWIAFYAAGVVLRTAARELTTAVLRGRLPVVLWFAVAVAGLWLAGHVLRVDATGAQSLQVTYGLLWLVAPLWFVYRLIGWLWIPRSAPEWFGGTAGWWERRAVARLAARGLVPLEPDRAPVLYRRVEARDGIGWAWEVRDHSTIVSGRERHQRAAERAANRAVFARTFVAPIAKRPGALYLVAPVAGNPYRVQVVEIGAVRSGVPAAAGRVE